MKTKMKIEKMNLWQRCEQLGPMEDQGVELYKNEMGDYRFYIDSMPVFHVHQDGTIGDYCREWLAEAILQRFEAITKQGGTVLTKENVVKEVERVYNEIPPCTPLKHKAPTPKEIEEVAEYLSTVRKERLTDLGLAVKTDAMLTPLNHQRWRVFWVSPSYGIGIKDVLIMEITKDGDGRFSVVYEGTWNGVCERIGFTVLPTPESLPEPTYIVESPKEFVSIPVGEYFDARASIEQVKDAFGKLSEAFAAISKMYTPEI